MAKPPKRIGLSQVEIVSPELRKALGITRPRNVKEAQEMGSRPTGLGTLFFPESKIQSAQARTIMGGSPTSGGISPGFAQAVTGIPTGLDQDAQTTLMGLAGMLPEPRPADLMKQQQVQTQQDDFSDLAQSKIINDQLSSIEEDVAAIDKSGVQNIIGPEEDVVGIQEEAEETEKENLTAAQEATKTALQEFLKASGKGTEAKEFKDYINEFGEATGLDISGDPDTKQALMSFGLALMQNRAGKGFDISNILRATGEAGEAAMPDFRRAVAEAKATRAKAGAFALSRKKEDQEKAQKRSQYLIIPKGTGGIKGTLNNLGKGNLANLNSFQLNNLLNTDSFNEQFEILPLSDKLLESFTKTKDFGEKYVGKYSDFSLFKDAPDDLKISVNMVNPNYKGTDLPDKGFFNPNQYGIYFNRLKRMDDGLTRVEDQLNTVYNLAEQGELQTQDQIADAATSFARAFGLKFGKNETTNTAKVKYILRSLAAKNAPAILQEAGKTISDADRQRVEQIVGQLPLIADEKTLQNALKEVYELIVVEGKKNVQEGLTNLNFYANKSAPKQSGSYSDVVVGSDGVFDVRRSGT